MKHTYLRNAMLASLSVLALGATAANYQCTPSEGTINMEAYPAGLNSVEVNGTYTINREAPGYITLMRDGVVLRQIPASNTENLYTYEGYNHTDQGIVHVTFFSTKDGAIAEGNYTVTVPEGFFTTVSDGQPTEAMEFNWRINATSLDISPAPGSYTSLHTFKITLPTTCTVGSLIQDIVSYQVSSAALFESLRDEQSPYNNLPVDITLVNNEATLTLETEVTAPDTYALTLPEGLFTYTTANGTAKSISSLYTFTVMPDSKAGIVITPAPGKYEEFASAKGDIDGTEFDYTFMITVPEEDPIKFALMGQVKLYPLAEDGTYDNSYGAPNAGAFRAIKKSDTVLALVPAIGSATQSVCPAPGRYALEVPANLYQLASGAKNGAYWFEYTVLPNSNMVFDITPSGEEELESLQTVTLTFEEGKEVACTSKLIATLTNGIAVYAMAGAIDEEMPNRVSFSIPLPLTEQGEWIFSTPGSGFTVGGQAFSMQRSFYINGTNVGIDSVTGTDAPEVYYNMQGVRVDNPGKGLYILRQGDRTVKVMR